MPTPHPIVQSLDARTRDLDLTNIRVATAIGCREKTVSAWRHGRNHPRLYLTVRWAELVNLELAAVNRAGVALAYGRDILGSLAQLRQRAGFSQQELARRTQTWFSRSTVSTLERGDRPWPSLWTVDNYLGGLGCRLILTKSRKRRTS